MTPRRWTGLVILGIFLFIGAYDLLVDQWGGNPSTFSRVLGDAGARKPMILVVAGVVIGGAVVHIFDLRQHTKVPASESSPDQDEPA